jgi:hypothetical protein
MKVTCKVRWIGTITPCIIEIDRSTRTRPRIDENHWVPGLQQAAPLRSRLSEYVDSLGPNASVLLTSAP